MEESPSEHGNSGPKPQEGIRYSPTPTILTEFVQVLSLPHTIYTYSTIVCRRIFMTKAQRTIDTEKETARTGKSG